MRLDLATQKDFETIIAFYDDVTERTPEMATYARWSKGKHPTVEGIRTYINEGSIYLYREHGAIVGAMAITMYQGEDYHGIDWSQQVPDEKVAVVKACRPFVSMPLPRTHPPTNSTNVSASSIAASSTSTPRTLAGQTSISLNLNNE